MDHKQHGFVLGHLLGHYSLARTFWVHGVGLSWCLYLLTNWVGDQGLEQELAALEPSRATLYWLGLSLVAAVVFVLLLVLWMCIGIIASAFRRIQAGDGSFLSLVAMAIAVGALYDLRNTIPEAAAAMHEFHQGLKRQPSQTESWRLST